MATKKEKLEISKHKKSVNRREKNLVLSNDDLVNKIFKPHCNIIFSNESDKLLLFVNATNIYENSLRNYLNIHIPNKLDLEYISYNDLIVTVKGVKEFPRRFIQGLNRVRIPGNFQRHLYLDSVTDLDLIVLRFEVTGYLLWFFKQHLKLPPMKVILVWYEKFISLVENRISDNSAIKKQLPKSSAQLENDLNETINYYKKVVNAYSKREIELTNEILRLKQKN